MCASGQQEIGLEYLHLAEEFFVRFRSPNAPQLARLRAIAGLCALAIGERKGERRLPPCHDAPSRLSPG